MNLVNELKGLIEGEVRDDAETLRTYSTDASVFRIEPQLVVFPKNRQDLQKLVEFVSRHKSSYPQLSLTVRAGGSDMTGGPLNDSIIVDTTKHLNQVKEIAHQSVTCEAGVRYIDLAPKLASKGLMYPSYPASREYVAIGGMVANNAGGEKSLQYGQTVDYVQKLKVILRDGKEYEFAPLTKAEVEKKATQSDLEGEIYRKVYQLITENYQKIMAAKPAVSKNSTGYLLWEVFDEKAKKFNLAKLFVGSQGTLGIITEATLALRPIQPYSQMLVAYLKSLDKLADIVNKILEFKPTSLESYDDKTLKLALRYAPRLAHLISQEESLFKLAWQLLPDFWIMLKMGGLPKLVLMVEFEGEDPASLKQKVQELNQALGQFKLQTHIPRSDQEAQKYWTIRRKSFDLLRKKIKGKQTAPFIDDLIVKPEKMPQFLPELNRLLSPYQDRLTYTIAGHAGNGNFHIIPLMDFTKKENRDLIPEISQKVYQLVLDYGGSLSAEHNDGLIRSPYLKQMYGPEIFELFRQVKRIFDPQNIFNPHKKTDAELTYSMAHIKTDNEHLV